MQKENYQPKSSRAKLVYFFWKNLPRLALLVLILIIVMLMSEIKTQTKLAEEQKSNQLSNESPPVNTVTYTLKPVSIYDRINLPGEIHAWTRLNLLAEVRGTIVKVKVKEGDTVIEGDIIAQIDPRDYKIALDRAQAAYDLAKADYFRDEKIYEKGVIPAAAFEARKTAMITAKADLENAKILLSRCTIKAPMKGTINRLDAKNGSFTSIGDPIAEILKTDKVKAVIGIPESDITAVRKLDHVTLSIQALGNRLFTGQKHFISLAPSSAARLYDMELAVDNKNGEILPGMFVRADIIKQKVDNTLSIPFYSVISRNKEQYVFVEKDGVVEKRNVKLGIMEQWMIQVVEGLESGENIVIEGQRDIEDQQKVKVVKNITDLGEYTL